jgi:hypothetical protein
LVTEVKEENETNIELVGSEDVVKEEVQNTELKNDSNEKAPDVKLCPKCKKIKSLFDTEKGPMCLECKIKRGL